MVDAPDPQRMLKCDRFTSRADGHAEMRQVSGPHAALLLHISSACALLARLAIAFFSDCRIQLNCLALFVLFHRFIAISGIYRGAANAICLAIGRRTCYGSRNHRATPAVTVTESVCAPRLNQKGRSHVQYPSIRSPGVACSSSAGAVVFWAADRWCGRFSPVATAMIAPLNGRS